MKPFVQQVPRQDDVSQVDTVYFAHGAVNFEGTAEVAYSVGHLAGQTVMDSLRAHGVVVELHSNTADNYRIEANLTRAMPCRQLLTVHDTLFSIATSRQSDWITVWSMNEGQPDTRNTLTPRYYAHPFEVTRGETLQRLLTRFAMSSKSLLDNNPTVKELGSELRLGTVLCVVPDWTETIGGNGQKICSK